MKLPVCPKCGKQLDHLVASRSAIVLMRLVAVDGKPQYIHEDSLIQPVDVEESYSCPECFRSIASTEKEAMAFLAGPTVREAMAYIR